MLRLGIGSYTFGWASGAYATCEIEESRTIPILDAEALLDRARSLDVSLVQLCDRPALHELSRGRLDDIRRRARQLELQVEIGTTGMAPAHLKRYIEIAERLQARLLRTLITQPSSGLQMEKAQIEEILPMLERSGVSLAIENHERYSCLDLARLVESFDARQVGICLDTVNSLGRGEGVQEVVDALMDRALCLQVKDFTAIRGASNMGFLITGAVAGQGRLDIPKQVSAYRSASPSGSVILEQWTPFEDSLERSIAVQEEWALEGLRYLKSVVARIEIRSGQTERRRRRS
jgi:sugar phosphate isomerase/epimerase